MTLTEHMTHGTKMTEPLIGNCTNHPDPDLWHPETPNGRPTKSMMNALAKRTNDAKTICNACPAKQECYEAGSGMNDLPYGIWGGKMAGERILELGYVRSELPRQSDLGMAIDFYERLKPYMERLENV